MPVEIDSDARPGSTLSVSPNSLNNGNKMVGGINMNAASGSPPLLRPTTTSRRGGRSRSPVSGVPRMAPPPINNATATTNPGPNETGENPSSAAAAAAAAAKMYATSRRADPWQQQQHPSDHGPPNDDGPPTSHRSVYGGGPNAPPPISGYPPPQHPHHHPPPPSGWPGEESSVNGYRSRGGPSSAAGYAGYDHHRRGGPVPPYREDYDRRYHGHHHREHPPPRYDDSRARFGGAPHRGMPTSSAYPHPDYHRYGGSASDGHNGPLSHHTSPHHPSSRGGPPSSSLSQAQHRPIQSPPDHRGSRSSYHHRPDPALPPPSAGHSYAPRGRDSATSALRTDSRSGSGGATTLVLGGTTPIHLPKSPLVATSTPKHQSSSSTSSGPPPHRGGSAASVFRGRIDSPNPSPTDKDSPENILLSMRTPSTSFEEIKDKANNKIQKTETLELDQSPPSSNSQQITSLFEVSY